MSKELVESSFRASSCTLCPQHGFCLYASSLFFIRYPFQTYDHDWGSFIIQRHFLHIRHLTKSLAPFISSPGPNLLLHSLARSTFHGFKFYIIYVSLIGAMLLVKYKRICTVLSFIPLIWISHVTDEVTEHVIDYFTNLVYRKGEDLWRGTISLNTLIIQYWVG